MQKGIYIVAGYIKENLSINYFTGILKNRIKTEVCICKMSSETHVNVSNLWNVLLVKCNNL